MALEQQTVTIPLKLGIDEGTDNAADPNGLMALENGVYTAEGRLEARPGFYLEADFTANEDRGLVRAGGTLGVVQRDAVLVFNPGSGVDPVQWGRSASAVNRTLNEFYGGRTVLSSDTAYTTGSDNRNYVAIASLEMSNNVDTTFVGESWFRVFDYNTGVLLYEAKTVASSNRASRVLAVGTSFLFFSQSGATLRAYPYNPATLTSGTIQSISTDVAQSLGGNWDVVYDGTNVYVGFILGSANEAKVAKCDTTGVVSATSVAATTASKNSSVEGECCTVGVIGNYVVIAFPANSDEDTQFQSYATNNLAIANNLDTSRPSGSGTNRNVAFAMDTLSSTSFYFVYSDNLKNLQYELFSFNNSTGAFTQPNTVITTPNLQAISKPFRVAGRWCSAVIHAASEEHLYLGAHVMDLASARVIATIAHDESLSYKTTDNTQGKRTLTTAALVATNKYVLSIPVSLMSGSAYDSQTQVEPTKYRIRSTELDFTANPLSVASVQNSSYMSGSLPREFDGFTTAEAAFVSAPRKPTLTAAAGSELTAGTYQYAAVLERSDKNGNIRLSPASAVSTVTLTTNRRVSVVAYNTVLVGYESDTSLLPSRATVRVYRTVADGSVFYLLRSIVSDANSSVTFTDITTDTQLTTAEQLDVTGVTELLSEPAPPLRAIWTYGNRVFGIRADNPRILSYTKEIAAPTAPEWNSVLTRTVESDGGDLVAGGELASACILFQDSQIMALGGDGPSGSGPDANGNDGFSQPEVVTKGVGARDAVSVVPVPAGLFFRSKKGFYILNQDMSPAFIGQAVQELEGDIGDTTAAAFLPSYNQVWVAGDDSPDILVFDTRFKRWAVFDGPWSALARVAGIQEVNGVVYVLTLGTTAQLWRYSPAEEFDFNGTTSVVPVVTVDVPWFKGAGDSGTFRVWRVIVTGRFPTGFNASESATLRFRTFTASLHDPRHDSESSDMNRTFTFDDTTDEGLVTVRVKPAKQRCSAFRCQLQTGGDHAIQLISIKYIYGVENEDGKAANDA